MTLGEAKQYIQSVRWQYAKTYITAPHEYTVLDWKPETKQKMIDFADFILDNGYKEQFYSKTFTVLQIDEYKYWSMDFPTTNTNLINRTFVDDARKSKIIDFVQTPGFKHMYGMSLKDVEEQMITSFKGDLEMKILDWNVSSKITDEKYKLIEDFKADMCILQECLPSNFEKYKSKWEHAFFYSDTIYAKDPSGHGIAIFSNDCEIRFTPTFNRNFRYVIPLEIWKDNTFLFYLFAVWTKSVPVKLSQNFIKALDFEGYKDYISGPAIFVGDFNTPTTEKNDKDYKTIISKGLRNCADKKEEYKPTYSHLTEIDFYTADYCFASEEMKKGFDINVTIHEFDKNDNTTKMKYKRMPGNIPLSDHVPLEIEISKKKLPTPE